MGLGHPQSLGMNPALSARIGKVLVVEDDAPLRGALVRLTGEWGAETFEANTVRRATELLEKNRPDLVIVDVRLPDGSGEAVVTAAARLHPHPVIVGISGLASAQESFELARLGADVYLTKPFSLRELEQEIEAVFECEPDLEPFISRAVGRESLPAVQRSVRKVMVEEAMAQAAGSRSGAARLLSVTRQAVQQALHSFEGERGKRSRRSPDR